MAVGMQRHGFGRARGLVAIFRRTAGMDVTLHLPFLQFLDQPGSQLDICTVDEAGIVLKGVGAIGKAIEHRAGSHRVEQRDQSLIHQQVAGNDSIRRQPFQSPGKRARTGAIDIASILVQQAQQVCADEATGAQHENRPLQMQDLGAEIARGHATAWASASTASTLAGSSPFSARWNACEP